MSCLVNNYPYMSINVNYPRISFPSENYPLVRYMDFPKFISLLKSQALFFCRLDALEDQLEGTTANPNRQQRVDRYKALRNTGYFERHFDDEEIENLVDDYYVFEQKQRSLHCVNCWNLARSESSALWKIYSANGSGIMVKSSRDGLVKAFENVEEEIFMSSVAYIDHARDLIPDGNTIFPVIHKNLAYSFEDEVRLIYHVMPEVGWEHDWSKEKISTGKIISINLHSMIEEIVVGPFAPSWYFEIVEDLISKYGIDKPVKHSVLRKPNPG